MIPPPTTSILPGTPSSSSALVESMIRGSAGRKGSFARCDDALVESDHLPLALGSGHLDVVRIEELRHALGHLDLALLGEDDQAAGELLDDRVLPATQLVDVHAGLAVSERDAKAAHLLHLVDHPRDVEQRLGRDAPDVEADAPQPRVALDQDRLEAEVRRAERGAVAARAGADHQHAGFEVHLSAVRVGRGRSGRWNGGGGSWSWGGGGGSWSGSW